MHIRDKYHDTFIKVSILHISLTRYIDTRKVSSELHYNSYATSLLIKSNTFKITCKIQIKTRIIRLFKLIIVYLFFYYLEKKFLSNFI